MSYPYPSSKESTHFQPEKFMVAAVSLKSSATSEIAFYVIGIVLLILPLVLYFVARNKKISKEECFDFTLDRDGVIKQLLQKARENHVHFDLVCTRLGIKQRHLQAYHVIDDKEEGEIIKFLGDDYLPPKNTQSDGEKKCPDPIQYSYMILHVPEGNVTAGWDDAPIEVYFQLTSRGQGTLYHFASFVQKIFSIGTKNYLLIIFPSILSNSQSKEEVRIEPLPENIEIASIWMYPKFSYFLPKQMAELGESMGTFTPTGASDFRIVNISATGTRLRFVADDLKKLPFTIEKHMEACLYLSVKTNHEHSQRMTLWLKCECKGLAPCADVQCVDVRFNFTNWEQITEQSSEINWKVATDYERVPPILHWIMTCASPKKKC